MAWLLDPIDEVHWIYKLDGTEEKVEGMDKILEGGTILPNFKFDLSFLVDDDDE